MKTIKEQQLKRLVNSIKPLQQEFLIDDDVSGGYYEEPLNTFFKEMYSTIDEIENNSDIKDILLEYEKFRTNHIVEATDSWRLANVELFMNKNNIL